MTVTDGITTATTLMTKTIVTTRDGKDYSDGWWKTFVIDEKKI